MCIWGAGTELRRTASVGLMRAQWRGFLTAGFAPRRLVRVGTSSATSGWRSSSEHRRQVVDDALEWVEAKCLRNWGAEVGVGVHIVEDHSAVSCGEVFNAADIQPTRCHDLFPNLHRC